jgi:hypothetical protein
MTSFKLLCFMVVCFKQLWCWYNTLLVSSYLCIDDYLWRAPKFLVRPKRGSNYVEEQISWNLVPLPALSTRRGRGACWGSGIRLGRGTSYSLTWTCIKPINKLVSSHFGTPLVLGHALGNTGLTTARTRGKPPPSPI